MPWPQTSKTRRKFLENSYRFSLGIRVDLFSTPRTALERRRSYSKETQRTVTTGKNNELLVGKKRDCRLLGQIHNNFWIHMMHQALGAPHTSHNNSHEADAFIFLILQMTKLRSTQAKCVYPGSHNQRGTESRLISVPVWLQNLSSLSLCSLESQWHSDG